MGRHANKNELLHPISSNEIDLCADIDQQPINFANWLHVEKIQQMKLKLKLTPEVLQAIDDCKKQQDAILELKVVDYASLEDTYITCFDL